MSRATWTQPSKPWPSAGPAPSSCATAGAWASAWWDFTLGWALLRWERLGPAQAHLEAAEAALAAAGLRLPALRCAFGLRLVEFNREAPPTLEPDLLALAGELELLGARSDALRARVQLALLEQLGPALGQVGGQLTLGLLGSAAWVVLGQGQDARALGGQACKRCMHRRLL